MIQTPWLYEYWHRDANFDLARDEKRDNRRNRVNGTIARVLREAGQTAAVKIAKAISSCRENGRCGHPICLHCSTAVNRARRAELGQIMSTSESMLMITLIPAEKALLPTKLADLEMTAMRAFLDDCLAFSGLVGASCSGALDVSWNEYVGRFTANVWVPHICMFVADSDKDTIREGLREAMARSRIVRRPYRVQLITHTPDRAFSYSFKNEFEAKRFFVGKYPRLIDRAYMKPNHPRFLDLAIGLHEIGMEGRLFQRP